MRRVLIVALLCCIAAPAFAADSRELPLEVRVLREILAEQVGNLAHAAALYQIEKEDHAADQKALNDLRAWVQAYFGG